MTADHDTYEQELLFELRLRDVPGDRIGEILAEVRAHVADTGEEPAAAFGSPTSYAATMAEATGERERPSPWRVAAFAAAFGAASFLLVDGSWGLATGRAAIGDLPAWVAVAAAPVLAGGAMLGLGVRPDPVRDPRGGGRVRIAPPPAWAVAVLVGAAVVWLGVLVGVASGREGT